MEKTLSIYRKLQRTGVAAWLVALVFMCCFAFTANGQQVVVTYSSAGSNDFVIPEGVTSVKVEAWAGGGAGSFSTSAAMAGGGGGGGAFATNPSVSVAPLSNHSVVIGAGGTGAVNAPSGRNGGNSSFGSSVIAVGGQAGGANTSAAGAGGLATACTPAAGAYSGGNATAGTGTSGSAVSGRGGGGAGSAGNGGNATGTGSGTGGTGGAGGGGTGGSGVNSGDNVGGAGAAYGGGGGGGKRQQYLGNNTAGGNGGNGGARVTYTFTRPTPVIEMVSAAMCDGAPATLSVKNPVSATNATIVYTWYRNGSNYGTGTSISVSTTGNYHVVMTYTYTYPNRTSMTVGGTSASNLTGTSYNSNVINVVVTPRPTATISGNATICNGETTNLIFGNFTGTGPWDLKYSHNGSDVETLTIATGDLVGGIYTKTVTPSVIGTNTYRISELTDAYCTALPISSTAVIQVNARPTGIVSVASQLCNGSSTNLTFTLSGIGPWDMEYSVNSGVPISVSVPSSPHTISVSPTIVGAYVYSIVSLEDANCEAIASDITSTATLNVVDRPIGVLSINDAAICEGSSTNLVFTLIGTPPFALQYSIGGVAQTAISGIMTSPHSIPVSPATGTYAYAMVSLSDANCTATAADMSGTPSLEVYSRPTATISGGATVCEGNTVDLTFGNFTGIAPWTLIYSNGSTSGLVNISSLDVNGEYVHTIIPPVGTRTYIISALTDGNLCAATFGFTGSALIIVNPKPVVAPYAKDICEGMTTVTIAHNATLNSAPLALFQYQIDWASSLLTDIPYTTAGLSGGTITFTIPSLPTGTYNGTLQIKDSNCESDPTPFTLTVKDNTALCEITSANPFFAGIICPNSNATFTAPSSMYSYLWTITGTGATINGANNAQTVDIITEDCGTDFTLNLKVVETSDPESCVSECSEYIEVKPLPFTMPANESSVVACASAIVAPAGPSLPIIDGCGETLVRGSIDSLDIYTNVTDPSSVCYEFLSSRIYIVPYVDCANEVYTWFYTYIVDDTSVPTITTAAPAISATIECVSEVVTLSAADLPVVESACGMVLEPIAAPVIENNVGLLDCSGNIKHIYTYKDCFNNQLIWTFTYNIVRTTAPAEVGGPAPITGTTVECLADAMPPSVIPDMVDGCGVHIQPLSPVRNEFVAAGIGYVEFVYDYIDCAGLKTVWTYTIDVEDTTDPEISPSIGTLSNLYYCNLATAIAEPAANSAIAFETMRSSTLTISDNCTPNEDLVVSHVDVPALSSLTTFPSTVHRTYTITDIAGNFVTVGQDIVVFNVEVDASVQDITVCPGDPDIDIQSPNVDIQYYWEVANADLPLIGYIGMTKGSGTDDLIFTPVNTSNPQLPITINVNITPQLVQEGVIQCYGATVPITITVNVTPVIESAEIDDICETYANPTVDLNTSVLYGADKYKLIWDDLSDGYDLTSVNTYTTYTNPITIALPSSLIPRAYTGALYITNVEGCETDYPVAFNVLAKPEITSVGIAPVCELTATTTDLDFLTNASPAVSYRIVWAGITPEPTPTSGTLTAGQTTITLDVPAGIAHGSYAGTLYISDALCESDGETFTLIVNEKPVITPESLAYCGGDAFNEDLLTVFGLTAADGISLEWLIESSNYLSAAEFGFPTTAYTGDETDFPTFTTGNPATMLTVIVKVTPLYIATNCYGETVDLTLELSPKPIISNQTINDVCFGATATTLAFDTNIPVTEYKIDWTSTNPSILTNDFYYTDQSPIILDITGAAVGTYTGTLYVQTAGSCESDGVAVSFTINEKPIILTADIDDICIGATSTLLDFTADVAVAEYKFEWIGINPTNLASGYITGIPPASLSILASATADTYTGTLYVKTAAGCESIGEAVTFTINPVPVIDDEVGVICNNMIYGYTPSGTLVPAGTTYTWLAPSVADITGTVAGTDEVNFFSGTLVNTTNDPITVDYTVTPTFGTCDGTPFTVSVTVNPTSDWDDEVATICTGTEHTYIPTGDIPAGTTYSWTRPVVAGLTGLSQGNGETDFFSGIIVNTTAAPIDVIFTVIPSTATVCGDDEFTVTITVNPARIISDAIVTICNIASYVYNPGGQGTTYTWLAPVVAGIGGIEAGTNATEFNSGVLINSTLNPITVVYTVIPKFGTCTGAPFTVSVTVSPMSSWNDHTATICNGDEYVYNPTGNIPAGTIYSWTRPAISGLTGLSQGYGEVNFFSGNLVNTTHTPIVVTFVVTPNTATACGGDEFTVTLTVRPTVHAFDKDVNICNNSAYIYTPDGLYLPTGTTYSWLAPITPGVTGIAAGNNESEFNSGVLLNSTTTPLAVSYIVTPTYNGCVGNTFRVIVVVSPTIAIDNHSTIICGNSEYSYYPTGASVPEDLKYSWQAPTVSGLTGMSTGNAATHFFSGTLVNTTNAPVTVTFEVTPSFGTCTGSPFDVTIIVNPLSAITPMATTINSGATFTATPVNGVNGVVYTDMEYVWLNPESVAGIFGAQAGNGTSITGTLINYNNVPTDVIYVVTPYSSFGNGVSCAGEPFLLTVTVNPAAYTIVSSVGTTGGTISPVGTINVSHGEDRSFTITPDQGFRIVSVIVDGVNVGVPTVYPFYHVVANHTIVANFERAAYSIVSSSDANSTIVPEGTTWVNAGTSQTYYFAAAGNNYTITQVIVDGANNTQAVADGYYTFSNVTASHTISVVSALKTFDIFASATTGGTITPSGTISVAYGANQMFTFGANSGYELVQVLVNNVNNPAAVIAGSYTFINVTQTNQTITAVFEAITYQIVATAGQGGTISPSGTIVVAHGTNRDFTITPNAGSTIMQVLVDGVDNPGAVGTGSYTFTNVTGNHTIEATFTESTYTIVASVDGSNGTITPSGTVVVNAGLHQMFNFTPDAGYHIATVLVDGVNNANAVATGNYLFVSVVANHTIEVAFAKNTYIISAEAFAGGAITPAGDITVEHGDNQTFTFTPDAGYKVYSIVVDGSYVNIANSYTFYDIDQSHTIWVSFVKITGIDEFDEIQLSIYPNPAQHFVNITSNVDMNNIQVFDMSGKKMMELKAVNQQNASIDVSMFRTGIYFINVDGKSLKLVKD